jgi:voltage-gated potassium channel
MIKRRIYELVEKGSHGSKVNLIFDYFIVSLIILNVVAVALDTLSVLNSDLIQFLKIFEIFSIIIFTVEFLMRLYVSDISFPASNKFYSLLKFICSPFGLIDLLAILPFYLPFIIKIDLRFLRVLRLIRFFRIFKISRYNSTLKLFLDVFKQKRAELQMTFFIAFLMVLISAFLMYHVENPVQPEKFKNIFTTLWWAVATLTSIDTEGITPVTILGKVLNELMSILGIVLIALPTGIISAGFIEMIDKKKSEKNKNVCPHCGKEI